MLERPFSQLPKVRILGRTTPAPNGPILWHTGSGFTCRYTGSALWLRVSADYDVLEPWLSVEINGAWLQRFPLSRGVNEICLFQNMQAGTVKRVRVLKECQAYPEDPKHKVQLLALRIPEEPMEAFLPVPEPQYRLEFVGDSITSGEGLAGSKEDMDWIPMFFSSIPHYARLTADALQAEYRIFSQSGWGICSGWNNDPGHVVMDYYTTVCGPCGDPTPYDFSTWPADAVIINLGTNDVGAMHQPPFYDPQTNEPIFQQKATPSGLARVSQAVSKALHTVRQHNPDALMVWAYGMVGTDLRTTIEAGIQQYQAETGDLKVYYLPLPTADPDTVGSRQHPGPLCHRQAADVLTAFLQAHLQ